MAENTSFSLQSHLTICGNGEGRPKFGHGQTMAERKISLPTLVRGLLQTLIAVTS